VLKKSVPEKGLSLNLSIEYLWKYSPDQLKLNQLKEKQDKLENEVKEHKQTLKKVEAKLK
jgi:hypothetical protein